MQQHVPRATDKAVARRYAPAPGRKKPSASEPYNPSLSEALLRDQRVLNVRAAILSLGQDVAIILPDQRRAMIHLVVEGEAQITVDGNRSVRLAAGDMALLFYGDRHAIGPVSDSPSQVEVNLLGLPTENTDEAAKLSVGTGETVIILSLSMQLSYGPPVMNSSRTHLWTMHKNAADPTRRMPPIDIGEMMKAVTGPGASAFVTVLAELYLFSGLRHIFSKFWHDRSMAVNDAGARRITQALQAIHGQMDQPWTVQSLARLVGMSRSGFAATFAEQVGATPLTYLLSLRMKRAARLLETGMQPLREVALRVGYPVQASFARAFAAYHGLSPTQYLQRLRAERGQGHFADAAGAETRSR